LMAAGLLALEYTATGLTFGLNYSFKTRAKNVYGFSAFSEELTLLCAFVPEPPLTVTTANSNEKVVVSWDEPIANGSPITSYQVFVAEQGFLSFTQISCEPGDILADRQCVVTLETLQLTPYLLVKDDPVQAKVVSVNLYGASVFSTEGTGAVI
jgi:hypothetical protein